MSKLGKGSVRAITVSGQRGTRASVGNDGVSAWWQLCQKKERSHVWLQSDILWDITVLLTDAGPIRGHLCLARSASGFYPSVRGVAEWVRAGSSRGQFCGNELLVSEEEQLYNRNTKLLFWGLIWGCLTFSCHSAPSLPLKTCRTHGDHDLKYLWSCRSWEWEWPRKYFQRLLLICSYMFKSTWSPGFWEFTSEVNCYWLDSDLRARVWGECVCT